MATNHPQVHASEIYDPHIPHHQDLPYDSFAIYPALNVARMGDSHEYFEGPSIPGLWVGGKEGFGTFREKDDFTGKIKKQAARFRIYGYKNGEVIREIKSNEPVAIQWQVQLGNKKAANMNFQGKLNEAQDLRLRNAGWNDRSKLKAVSKLETIDAKNGHSSPEVHLTATIFDNVLLKLGSAKTDVDGSLLVLPSNGKSGSIDGSIITSIGNNDGWWDRTADGPITATVELLLPTGRVKLLPNKLTGHRSWVICAPPKFAPAQLLPRTLYNTISETQRVPGFTDDKLTADGGKVSFNRDISPILQFATSVAWVNPEAWKGHAPGKPGNFHKYWEELSSPNPDYSVLRRNIFQRIRIPPELATPFEWSGQAYPYFMPPMAGDNNDKTPADPTTWFSVSKVQYLKLKHWVENDFVPGPDPAEPPAHYSDIPILEQPNALNKAALEWCVGAPFFPGIEISYQVYKPETFQVLDQVELQKDELRNKLAYFRFANVYEAGDVTRGMAVPWQADFYDCHTHWWPATRPDRVLVLKHYNEYVNKEETERNERQAKPSTASKVAAGIVDSLVAPLATAIKHVVIAAQEAAQELQQPLPLYTDMFKPWARGLRNNEDIESDVLPCWGNMDMVTHWSKMGFVVPVTKKPTDENPSIRPGVPEASTVYCELGRTFENPPEKHRCQHSIDDLESLLQTALIVELTTIPAYLYAMYSIKDDTPEGVQARKVIRSIAVEEMLHASLVANIMSAVGINPHFYRKEMCPFYPNPIPQLNHGALEVQLAIADEENIDRFIEIEKPDPHNVKQTDRENPGQGLCGKTNVNEITSIGKLYEEIDLVLEELNANDMIKWSKEEHLKRQLQPGMGFAPKLSNPTSSPNQGLLVVTEYKDAHAVITEIVSQGEGHPTIEAAEDNHWKSFKYIKKVLLPKYNTYPSVKNPKMREFPDDVAAVALAFNASYCYLLLVLETAWQTSDETQKRNLIIGGMSSLMVGVLGSIADFLVKTPLLGGVHAGPTFSFFEFLQYPHKPKEQLLKAIKGAVSAFPNANQLKTALLAASALPELSHPFPHVKSAYEP